MTTTAAPPVVRDEFLDMALKGRYQALLHILRLGDRLTSDEHHQLRTDLQLVLAGVVTHQHQHAKEVG